MKTIISLVIIFFSPAIFALDDCEHTESSFRCVEYVRNYDGDTITFNLEGIHPLLGRHINIRVLGIDAPEIRGVEDCEKQIAFAIRDYVAKLMLGAQRIDLVNIARGKFFRVLANVHFDGVDLSDHLLAKGYAVVYNGGSRPDVDWCAKNLKFAF